MYVYSVKREKMGGREKENAEALSKITVKEGVPMKLIIYSNRRYGCGFPDGKHW